MGSIALVMTGRNSGAYELLNHHFFRLTKDIVPDFVPASQNEVLDYAAAHPQAIGFVSLACLNNPFRQKAEQDTTAETVRPLAFAGLDSTGQQAVFKLHQANVYWGKYPLHYPVFIYFNTERSELAAGFSSFMSGVQGQKIILNWGLVPATMPVRIVQLS
jgi:phosphate transport system substrate-binding protein